MADNQPTYEFHHSWLKYLFWAVALSCIAIIFNFVVSNSSLPQIFDILFNGFFIAGALFCLGRGLQTQSVMTITANGIFHRRKMRKPIPWSEVRSIGFTTIVNHEGRDTYEIKIFVDNSAEYRHRLPKSLELLSGFYTTEKYRPFKIDANRFQENTAKVYNAFAAYGPPLPPEAKEKLLSRRN